MPLFVRISAARLIAGIALAILAAAGPAAASDANPPPVAARKPVTSTHHGVRLSDDYAWMRTAKPEAILTRPELLEAPIRRHLDAEKRYAERMLAPNAALVAKMVQEMRGRTSAEGDVVPEANGPYAYSSRFAPGAERKVHVRTPRNGGPEEILLDENVLAKGRRNFTLDETSVSVDHKLFAYTFDIDGSERQTLKVRDLATGRDLADTIADVRGAPVWSNDGRWLFYVRRDPTKWARTIWRHRLGTPVAKDVRVYEEKEEGFSVGITTSLSNRFMAVELSDFSTAQMGYVDLDAPETPLRLMTPRIAGVKFAISDLGDRLIVASNADGAKTWKIGARALAAPAEAPLETLIPARADRLIQSVVVYKDHLVRLEPWVAWEVGILAGVTHIDDGHGLQ